MKYYHENRVDLLRHCEKLCAFPCWFRVGLEELFGTGQTIKFYKNRSLRAECVRSRTPFENSRFSAYLELLVTVHTPQTYGIRSTVFIEEVLQLLLQPRNLVSESFLIVTIKDVSHLKTIKKLTAYMLLSNCPFGSVTSAILRTFLPSSSTSTSSLVFRTSTSQSFPYEANSFMRLKDATVSRGTQCSSFLVWSVHMNLGRSINFRLGWKRVVVRTCHMGDWNRRSKTPL